MSKEEIDDLLEMGVEVVTPESIAKEKSELEKKFEVLWGLTPEEIDPAIKRHEIPDTVDIVQRWIELQSLEKSHH